MEKQNNNKSKFLGVLLGIGALALGKLKYVLVVLKIFKFSTLFSMFLSIGAYAMIYGWKFAVALVALLAIHEGGHGIAAKMKGIPTSPALFIPFMGAVIGLKEQPKDAKTESFVGYMGPLFGLFSVVIAAGIYLLTEEPFWAMVIMLGGMINLFNLMPVSPLDGGRILAVVSPRIWLIGLGGLIFAAVSFGGVLVWLIILFGIGTIWNRFKQERRIKELSTKISIYDTWREKIGEPDGYQALVWRMNELERKANLSMAEKWEAEVLSHIEYHTELEATEEGWKRILDEQSVREEIERWRSEMEPIVRYYETSSATKWKVVIAYILLAAALGGMTEWGRILVEAHRIEL
ncbi:MAG: site-2 protease family protein [Ectobacillus sp.]